MRVETTVQKDWLTRIQIELGKLKSHQMTFAAQLLDPELLLRHLGFTNFLSTWVIRQVDPLKTHPNPLVE